MFVCLIRVNAVEVSDEADLNTALTGTDARINLSGNITLTAPLEILRDVTIDLNGYKITPDASLSGFVSPSDYMFGVHRNAHLTIMSSREGGKISNNGANLAVVKLTVAGETDATYAAKFTLNSGSLEDKYIQIDREGLSPITGHGSRHNTEITINGGEVISQTNTAIFNPQNGKLTINGGLISGTTGIEMRAGKLVVTAGNIFGTANSTSTRPNGSGQTTTGVGIAIVQHTTKLELSANVTGGLIKGHTAFYHNNTQNNDETAVNKVTLDITGGTFETINGGTNAIHSDTKQNFIKGGEFNGAVEDSFIDSSVEIKEVNGVTFVGTSIPVNNTNNTTTTVKNPNTVDNIGTFALVGLVSLLVGGFAINKLRKNA